MINADIAGDLRAQGVFAFDAAARGHCRFRREERFAYFAILVRAACRAKQGAILSPGAEILRCHKTTLPEPAAVILCFSLIGCETVAFPSWRIHGQSSADQKLIDRKGFAFGSAEAEAPFRVRRIRAAVVA